MVEQAIGLGLVISLIFSETLGLAAGGMVVPGYLALMIHEPLRLIGTVLVGLLTYCTLKLLSRYVLIFGRRRIVLAILVGFGFGALSRNLLVLHLPGTVVDLSTIRGAGFGARVEEIGRVLPEAIETWTRPL